jgi:hypothetical protein
MFRNSSHLFDFEIRPSHKEAYPVAQFKREMRLQRTRASFLDGSDNQIRNLLMFALRTHMRNRTLDCRDLLKQIN